MSRRKKKYYGDGAEVRAQDEAEKDRNPYSKYRAKRTEVDGIMFASKAESRRYIELRDMQKRGEIRHLELQPRFRLEVNGVKICDYIADFRYVDADGEDVVEDVKGVITPQYRMKRNLMAAIYGVTILETTG